MKKLTILLITLGLSIISLVSVDAGTAVRNGCYICQRADTYVKFIGEDNNKLRKKAFTQFGCKVYAVMDQCHITTNSDGYTWIEGTVK